jgi:transcriptional regulator with XRE-family HTH domain
MVGKLSFMPPRIGPKRQVQLFIAEWRENRGLTQEQLAGRLGCSDVTVSRWETRARQPDLNAQEAIAEALDIDAVDLRRHPNRPSADALLRDQPPEVVAQAMKLIQAIRR